MIIIDADTPGIAWKQAYDAVMKDGGSVKDDDINLKEIIDMFVTVKNASDSDKYLDKYADPKMIDWMVDENFGGDTPILDWGYCYGMRFSNFNGINQIENIVNKLKKNPESKSATISLMDPSTDYSGHMPCIMTLDFKYRNNKLDITGFFRSQDIGKKFYADILALSKIQQQIAESLLYPVGSVKIYISSAHIYEPDFGRFDDK